MQIRAALTLLYPQRNPFAILLCEWFWREDSANSAVHLPRQWSPWGAKRTPHYGKVLGWI